MTTSLRTMNKARKGQIHTEQRFSIHFPKLQKSVALSLSHSPLPTPSTSQKNADSSALRRVACSEDPTLSTPTLSRQAALAGPGSKPRALRFAMQSAGYGAVQLCLRSIGVGRVLVAELGRAGEVCAAFGN